MRYITLHNKKDDLSALILPEYGGMTTRICYRGKEILAFEEEQVHTANLLAGGCPVLFPFPSRTSGDKYVLNGKTYHMPFHGLVKNAPFAVESVSENSVSLYITNTQSSKEENYPFDFVLRLTYTIIDNTIFFEAETENKSDTKMPHYFGWHHYFKCTDTSKISVSVPMKYYEDYLSPGLKGETDGNVDARILQDRVFSEKTGNNIRIVNRADNWQADMETDDSFEAVVVCTIFDGRVTCEPWLGLPDSINSAQKQKYVKWVEPRSKETYRLKLTLNEPIGS